MFDISVCPDVVLCCPRCDGLTFKRKIRDKERSCTSFPFFTFAQSLSLVKFMLSDPV